MTHNTIVRYGSDEGIVLTQTSKERYETLLLIESNGGGKFTYLTREDCVKLCAYLMSKHNIRCNEIADAMNIPNRCTDNSNS